MSGAVEAAEEAGKDSMTYRLKPVGHFYRKRSLRLKVKGFQPRLGTLG